MVRVSKVGSMAAVFALVFALAPVSAASAAPCVSHARASHQINAERAVLRDAVKAAHKAAVRGGNHGRRGSDVGHGRHGSPSQMRELQKFLRTARKLMVTC